MNRNTMPGTIASTANAHARREALIDDVEWLLDLGNSAELMSARLGSTPDAIARRLYRAGRHDLARPFASLAQRNRRHECADCGSPGIDRQAVRCVRCAAYVREASAS